VARISYRIYLLRVISGKNGPKAELYLKILGARLTERLIIEGCEERTEGIFYSAIAYENAMPEAPSRPLPELYAWPMSRPIVYLDTSCA